MKYGIISSEVVVLGWHVASRWEGRALRVLVCVWIVFRWVAHGCWVVVVVVDDESLSDQDRNEEP